MDNRELGHTVVIGAIFALWVLAAAVEVIAWVIFGWCAPVARGASVLAVAFVAVSLFAAMGADLDER